MIGTQQLNFFPTPGFLRKNERQDFRYSSVTIPAMTTQGQPLELCPVRALKAYLEATKTSKDDALFIDPASGAPLSTGKIASYLVSLISKANPGVKVRAHDTRKYAGSLAWMRQRDLSRVQEVGFWSSAKTFFDHYLSLNLQEAPLVMLGVVPSVQMERN